MSWPATMPRTSIDQLFPVNPLYEHLFTGESFACNWKPEGNSKVAVLRAFIQDGYWHCSVMDRNESIEDYLSKAACKGLVCNFLERHEVPSDKSAWWVLDVPKSDRLHFVNVSMPQRPIDPDPSERTNVVYFVRAGGFVKIGFTSKAVHLRINEFKTGCPYETELIGTIDGDLKTERSLHRRFAHLRSSGEWFIATDELISYISKVVQP